MHAACEATSKRKVMEFSWEKSELILLGEGCGLSERYEVPSDIVY